MVRRVRARSLHGVCRPRALTRRYPEPLQLSTTRRARVHGSRRFAGQGHVGTNIRANQCLRGSQESQCATGIAPAVVR